MKEFGVLVSCSQRVAARSSKVCFVVAARAEGNWEYPVLTCVGCGSFDLFVWGCLRIVAAAVWGLVSILGLGLWNGVVFLSWVVAEAVSPGFLGLRRSVEQIWMSSWN